jgi:hypothetical protein
MNTALNSGAIGKGLARTHALMILAMLAAVGKALWQLGSL